jgi:predicted nucleic-acid-binding protein
MVLIDTNIVLRYALDDHHELSPKAKEIMVNEDVFILTQVIAETIYVLKGVYKSTRQEIAETLRSICSMDNVSLEHEEIVISAINEFSNTNLDFVDVLLYSHQKLTKIPVATFDTGLISKLKELQVE